MKAPPIRLLHGGCYAKWARDYGIADVGASLGGGLPLVTGLVRQLRTARRLLVTEMRRRDPAWTEAAHHCARILKAPPPHHGGGG